jgi:hypothetical protein
MHVSFWFHSIVYIKNQQKWKELQKSYYSTIRYTSPRCIWCDFVFLILKNYILVSSPRASSLRGDAVVRTWMDRPEQADVSVVQLLDWPRVVLHVLQHKTHEIVSKAYAYRRWEQISPCSGTGVSGRFSRPSSINRTDGSGERVCGKQG